MMEGKKKSRKSKVGVANDSFELEEASATVKNKVSPFLNNIINAQAKNNNAKSRALEAITDAKMMVSKWKDFVNRRRKRKKTNLNEMINANTQQKVHLRSTSLLDSGDLEWEDNSGLMTGNQDNMLGLDDIHDDFTTSGKVFGNKKSGTSNTMSSASNQALLQYFAKLGKSTKDEVIDLDFVEQLLHSGANINCTDRHGQTLLHEVASKWHVDVGKFLISLGADVNQTDNYGRSPLHVAAADNYPDMVYLLIDSGANRAAETNGEKQTPVHYAARNDAVDSLKALVKRNCAFKEVYDYKGRTPLLLAAELDRSETARLLLDLDAPCGVTDHKGQSTISWMIAKMPPVALEAITQFHIKDRPNRKQYYYLNMLVPDRNKDPKLHIPMPLAIAVKYKQYDILTQSVVHTLTDQMWKRFARIRAYGGLVFNLMYILLWTLYGVTTEYDKRHEYKLPGDWWRIVLLIAAVGITVWQVIDEILEYRRSNTAHDNQNQVRKDEIEEDMKYCHPRWPEEKRFLEDELRRLDESHTRYFTDWWNWFDWICYLFLLAVITTHFVDIGAHNLTLARAHIRLTAVVIILLWVRLMKNIRAFSTLGPFVVMVGAMLTDILKFGFLYLEFYIPYVCAFWMIFGGTKYPESAVNGSRAENITVEGFEQFNSAMFTMWRMTLVDEYDYPTMKEVDSIMADILVGTWLFLSAVLCLNLLIALFSDTFQRVYDNAKAIALMQKAIMIISYWENMGRDAKMKFLTHIEETSAPLEMYYDDDMTETDDADLKKVTIQIKEQLDDFMEKWQDQFGDDDDKSALEELREEDTKRVDRDKKMVSTQRFETEINGLREEIHLGLVELQKQQTHMMNTFKRDMKMVKSLLLDLSGGARPPGSGPVGAPGGPVSGEFPGYGGYMGESMPPPPPSAPTAVKRLRKKPSHITQSTMLEGQPGVFATSAGVPAEPVVEVSTQDYIPLDPYRTDVASARSSIHDPDSVA